ncbi:helix-turn-helix domain-containing protein [Chryseobacterium wangxinyae]|uniref:helix-turn-helix domain-containing protein n=1 Tax=Chryseobacterium sp. CY353 TaxID=2997334 RepID=UPI00226F6642|nr:helix-turn-helix domain-containing protein [Chryseobacterium sp. CY353]MCY0971041.1 helix-turn-helix domain-containing protein [Chryseobacterium sp. CY353]
MTKPDRASTRFKKKMLLKALEKSLAVISPACQMVGINRQTFYNWLKSDSQLKQQYEDIKEKSLDFAEISLLQQIAEHNTTATIFYLKTKGKLRGYGQDNYYISNNNLNEVENLTNEQLWAIINKK